MKFGNAIGRGLVVIPPNELGAIALISPKITTIIWGRCDRLRAGAFMSQRQFRPIFHSPYSVCTDRIGELHKKPLFSQERIDDCTHLARSIHDFHCTCASKVRKLYRKWLFAAMFCQGDKSDCTRMNSASGMKNLLKQVRVLECRFVKNVIDWR